MSEQLLTPDDLAKLVPSRRKGRHTSAQTIRRWMLKGLKGKFLKYTRVGSIPCTSAESLQEFFAQLTEVDEKNRFHHVDDVQLGKPVTAKKSTARLNHFNSIAEDLGL